VVFLKQKVALSVNVALHQAYQIPCDLLLLKVKIRQSLYGLGQALRVPIG
jgi:hypothetical protein